MSIIYRFGYYLAGITLGLVVVFYINKQKKVSFDYMPNARTLKQIKLRDTLIITDKAKAAMNKLQLTQKDIDISLTEGEVDFGKSHPRTKPCKDYWIDVTIDKKINNQTIRNNYTFIYQRCEYQATLVSITKN